MKERHLIVGAHIHNRGENALKVQKLLTKNQPAVAQQLREATQKLIDATWDCVQFGCYGCDDEEP